MLKNIIFAARIVLDEFIESPACNRLNDHFII